MTLQQITVSLEMAKQLEEAGFPQKSLFYWGKSKIDNSPVLIYRDGCGLCSGDSGELYSAPTPSEILEELPLHTLCYKTNKFYRCYKGKSNVSLADAMAKDWLISQQKRIIK